MTRSFRTGRHWSADGLDLHAGPVEGCPECAASRAKGSVGRAKGSRSDARAGCGRRAHRADTSAQGGDNAKKGE